MVEIHHLFMYGLCQCDWLCLTTKIRFQCFTQVQGCSIASPGINFNQRTHDVSKSSIQWRTSENVSHTNAWMVANSERTLLTAWQLFVMACKNGMHKRSMSKAFRWSSVCCFPSKCHGTSNWCNVLSLHRRAGLKGGTTLKNRENVVDILSFDTN